MSTSRITPQDTSDITALLTRFAWDADEGTAESLEKYFTEDSVWTMGDSATIGTEAIKAMLFKMRQAGHAGPDSGARHLIINIDIADEIIDNTVKVRSIFVLATGGEQPIIRAIGTYHDTVVCDVDEGLFLWRFLGRCVVSV